MRKRVRQITTGGAIVVVAILAAATWAGVRQDANGNQISQDIVAPGGGGQIVSGGGAVLNGSVGQAAVGLSLTTADTRLYSGIHAPQAPGIPPAVWLVY
jgi:hypothetical protein